MGMSSDSFLKRMPAIATTEYNDITHQISYLKNAFGFPGEYSCEDEGRCERFMRPLIDQEARLAPMHLDLDVWGWFARNIGNIEPSHYGCKTLPRPCCTQFAGETGKNMNNTGVV
jgi:hypothetical protein